MNYGIFKGGKFTGGEDRPSAIRRHMGNEKKPKLRRRFGCLMLVLPVAAILLYLVLRSGIR
ncbi:hypothetical protein [Acetanaerobacterium elongatum]|uniref:Uncharacterized protein n=1 Tax=Acetanaerobacterium elongatum TaxID=258515 RepID=A0A1G9ZP21_9FIRM|nr:hypothetical protein [Acetanaerobacterium elongatum]SDN23272.1 hypothetical protein SAMN05192585_1148 [Acetanaerobacterium elongatum]